MTVYISELLKGIAKAKTRAEKKKLLEQYKVNVFICYCLKFQLSLFLYPRILFYYQHFVS